MTLGRPPITSGQSYVPLPMAVNDDSLESIFGVSSPSTDDPPLVSFFVQAIKLNKILAEILSDVYRPWSQSAGKNQIGQQLRNNSFDAIIKLDYTLSDFESNIPKQLHWARRDQTIGSSEIIKRQVNVLHARFVHINFVFLTIIANS